MLNCQVGRDEKLRPSEGLMDSREFNSAGVLMKMGSVDLMVCQGSSGSIPYCQVGRDEQMKFGSARGADRADELAKNWISRCS
jgi:hypothetical protein